MINFTQKMKDLGSNNKKVSIRMKSSIELDAVKNLPESQTLTLLLLSQCPNNGVISWGVDWSY
jgi:hypothetical protein